MSTFDIKQNQNKQTKKSKAKYNNRLTSVQVRI